MNGNFTTASAGLWRKALAVFLALVMTLYFVPTSSRAWADEPSGANSTTASATEDEQNASVSDAQPITNAPESIGTPTDETADQASTEDPEQTATDENISVASDENAAESSAVENPVFAIGNAQYATIADAAAAAKEGDTLELLQDVDLSNAGAVQLDGVTFDLGGHTIKATNSTFFLLGNDLVIQNGTFDSKGGSYGLFIGDNPTTFGTLVQNVDVIGGVNIFNAIDVVLKNVNVDVTQSSVPYYAVWCDVQGQATIISGTYKSNGPAVLGATTKHDGAAASTILVKGGDFQSDGKTLVYDAGDNWLPSISGGTFFSKDAAEPYLKDGVTLVDGTDGKVSAVSQSSAAPEAESAIDDGEELVITDLSDNLQGEVDKALGDPDLKAALDETTGSSPLWEVNVVLRDKDTLQEDHGTQVTFVLPYPDDVDATDIDDYEFTVLHVKMDSQDSSIEAEPEILEDAVVTPKAEGLEITSTLSPFVISYDKKAAPSEPAVVPSEPTTPSAPTTQPDESGDKNSAGSDASKDDGTSADQQQNSSSNSGNNASKQQSEDDIAIAVPVESAMGDRAQTRAGQELLLVIDPDEITEITGDFKVVRHHTGHEQGIEPGYIAAGALALVAAAAFIIFFVIKWRRDKEEDQA